MTIISISVEGVLTESVDLRNSSPTTFGRRLYSSWVGGTNSLILLSASPDVMVRRWLAVEGFDHFTQLYTAEHNAYGLPIGEWKRQVLNEMVASNTLPSFHVECDVEVARAATMLGIPTLIHIPSAPLVWLDSTPYAPWSTVEDLVDEQRIRRAERRQELSQ